MGRNLSISKLLRIDKLHQLQSELGGIRCRCLLKQERGHWCDHSKSTHRHVGFIVMQIAKVNSGVTHAFHFSAQKWSRANAQVKRGVSCSISDFQVGKIYNKSQIQEDAVFLLRHFILLVCLAVHLVTWKPLIYSFIIMGDFENSLKGDSGKNAEGWLLKEERNKVRTSWLMMKH